MAFTEDCALFAVEFAFVEADESDEPAEDAADDAPESELAEEVAHPAADSAATALKRMAFRMPAIATQ